MDMTTKGASREKRPLELTLRWIARVGGLATCFFFGFIGFGEVSSEVRQGIVEGVPIVLMIGLAIVGYLLSWRHESHGGLLMLSSGVMLALTIVVSGLSLEGSPDASVALLFLACLGVPGVLFLVASSLAKRQ